MPSGLHRLSIPTPFAVGPVNCYLVDDDPLTLVDAGPDSGTSLVALARALGEHGRRLEDVERLILTHQHPDHVGLAHIVVDRSGAELWALDQLIPWMRDFDTSMEADDAYAEGLLLRHGVPEDVVTALRSVARLSRHWGAAADVTHGLRDGDVVPFAGRAWSVHHRPGHSPSDLVFHDAASRELVAGDHLIRHISSNAVLGLPLGGEAPPDRPHMLRTYMASLAATREMDVALVLPGHGDPFEGHVALIDERAEGTERRLGKIAGLLAAEPLTVHEISQRLWGRIAITQAFLTLSEVLGHVDLLIDRGQVAEVQDGALARFVAV